MKEEEAKKVERNGPVRPISLDVAHMVIHDDKNGYGKYSSGETKFEKAFWGAYIALAVHPEYIKSGYDSLSSMAIEIVNAGFKALEEKSNDE